MLPGIIIFSVVLICFYPLAQVGKYKEQSGNISNTENIKNIPDTSCNTPAIKNGPDTAHKVPDFSNVKGMNNFIYGIWHALPYVPAGYSDLYVFFESGHYIYQEPQVGNGQENKMEELVRTEGIWQYEKNGSILYQEKYKYYSMFSGTIFTGYKVISCNDEKVKSLNIAVVPENTLKDDELEHDRIRFNGKKFWKITFDPYHYYEILETDLGLTNYNNQLKLNDTIK